VALVDLTKQLAGQALRAKDAIDAIRPADQAPAEDLCAVVLGQVQAMQRALKEEDELQVLCSAAGETVRVLEVFVPSPNVVVLTGIDTNRGVARVISHIEAVQLVCRVVKVQPPARPARISFIVPKQPQKAE
jgi:hypothetical protein